ncbi:apolipoprotein N-acyltransferase [Gulosibacter sp. 10]|uniref:apolipoprotein N-acyltransferase n=1 Tax=Gulosibacter sp. 10 TaxID=1255570 RepID=UPI00097F5221|nr:apolipoprotein N-acyltransferase [Gulosibacter sp. 10]SJM52786.1 Apolipoprotein N-acyltransferase in lipid-linked oligosaccharide synthesis cluster [Gulosibacter sp. 10]
MTALPGPNLAAPANALSRAQASCAAAAGALLLPLAFPDRGWWPMALLAVTLLLLAVRGQRPGFAALLGFGSGLVFYLLHVEWTSLFLGALPWVALSTLMAAWWAAAFPLIALAYRRLPSARGPGGIRALGALPVAVAGIWTLREALSSTVPYGGFAWGRLAQSQSDSPLTALVSWVGLSGLSFLMVWFCAFAVELLLAGRPRGPEIGRGPGSRARELGLRLGALAVAAGLLCAWPLWPTPTDGTVRVLAVQGDTPGASYFIPSERGEVLAAHLEATRAVDPDADVDLILWPEGSMDVSPFASPSAAAALDRLAAEYGAPVLANTVTMDGDYEDPDTRYYNTQFLWSPGEGSVAEYDKAHPIPFGEYVPNREFFMALAPDLIGLIQREYTPGTRSNVLERAGTGFGVFICYDIVDDALVRQTVEQGAGILLAPTNNADFGTTEESAQQLATARLRAVETGRATVQASTVGWSAAYLPDGGEVAALDWYTPGAFVVELPVATGDTGAMLWGRSLEVLVSGLGLVLVLLAPRRGPAGTPGTAKRPGR